MSEQDQPKPPITIPYGGIAVQLSSAVDSVAAVTKSDPFLPQSPFDQSTLQDIHIELDARQGNTSASFTSTSSSHTSSSRDHLSLSGEVSVGWKYLGGSGSGWYDETLSTNVSQCKSSQRSSYVAGIVRLKQPPKLSRMALDLLQAGVQGRATFRQRYGDYFLESYVLGAEAAVMLSTALNKLAAEEAYSFTLEAHELCFSQDYDKASAQALILKNESFGLDAFDTITGLRVSKQSVPSAFAPVLGDAGNVEISAESVIREAAASSLLVQNLGDRYDSVAKEHLDGKRMTWLETIKLCRAGLIVALNLQPYTMLRDYIEATIHES